SRPLPPSALSMTSFGRSPAASATYAHHALGRPWTPLGLYRNIAEIESPNTRTRGLPGAGASGLGSVTSPPASMPPPAPGGVVGAGVVGTGVVGTGMVGSSLPPAWSSRSSTGAGVADSGPTVDSAAAGTAAHKERAAAMAAVHAQS